MSMPPNVQVNVIGHSLGGATVAKVALENPSRISALVTIDPVSRFSIGSSDYSTIRSSAGAWINVNATGKPGTSLIGEITSGNFAAGFGGAWDKSPKPYADIHIEAPYNHGDFSGMIGYDIAGGRTIKKILNRGR